MYAIIARARCKRYIFEKAFCVYAIKARALCKKQEHTTKNTTSKEHSTYIQLRQEYIVED